MQQVLTGDVTSDYAELKQSHRSTEERLAALEGKLEVILQHLIGGIGTDGQ